jgi:hypothetical protein
MPVEYLNEMYDQNHSDVRLLFKYRSCEDHNISCLKDDSLWFSAYQDLNDPFDCAVRLPSDVSNFAIEEIKRKLIQVGSYSLDLVDPVEIATYSGNTEHMAELAPLGLIAAQLGKNNLVKHLRNIKANDTQWTGYLLEEALDVAHFLLDDIAIFCLSEHFDSQLMWAHYGDSHKGFCTGYVSPTGIGNPRIIHRVVYRQDPPDLTYWDLISAPWKAFVDLAITKTSDWRYEAEWRIAFGNTRGLNQGLLPIRQVILGSRISSVDEAKIRKAISGKRVELLRVVLNSTSSGYSISIEDA